MTPLLWQGLLPAGVPDRPDQVLDPARLGDAQRGRRGRRLRRACCWRCSPAASTSRCWRSSLPHHGAHRRHGVLHHHQRHLLCLRLPRARRRRHRREADHARGPRPLGPPVPDHGHRVLPRLLPRLDRDHADRAAGVRADDRQSRLRRPRAQGRRGALVRHPDGGQPADVVPDAAVRLRAVLSQGHRAEGDQDPEHLSRHHPVRDPAAHGASSSS